MTSKRNAPVEHRVRPIREHVYTLPVVRELPAPPADQVGSQSLW
jgi:hypothetical protein